MKLLSFIIFSFFAVYIIIFTVLLLYQTSKNLKGVALHKYYQVLGDHESKMIIITTSV